MDEPMDDSEKEFNFSETNDLESFEYFISLLLDLEKEK